MNTPQGSKTKDLHKRTKEFAIAIIRLYSSLSKSTEYQVIGKQFLRSGTSVGAHYAEAKRAKSSKDFITKLEGALQELEETAYWLELLSEIGQKGNAQIPALRREAVNCWLSL